MGKITGFSVLLGANIALIGSAFITLGVVEAIKSNSSKDNVIEEEIAVERELTNEMVNNAIQEQHKYDKTTDPNNFIFPQKVKVTLGDKDYVVNLQKIKVEHSLGAIVWKGETTTAEGEKKTLEGKLLGFQTKEEQNIEKANNALAKLNANDIDDAIRKTSGVVISSAVYPDKFKLPPKVNVEIDGVNIVVVLTKKSWDTNLGVVTWGSVATTTVAGSNERSDINGLVTGFWKDPLYVLEKIIRNDVDTTMSQVRGNFIIEGDQLKNFNLTLDSLNLKVLENKISNLKVEQQRYDFKEQKMVLKINFDFVGAREQAEFIIKISNFKEPKVTLDDPTKIGIGEFLNLWLPDDFTISPTVTLIDDFGFAISGLNENFQVPDTVTTINKGAFLKATIPKAFKLPKAWETSIPYHGFRGAIFKGEFTLPNTLTSIEEGAFKDATLPIHFTIPNSVTTIGEQALSMDGKEIPATLQLPTNPNFQVISKGLFQHSIMNVGFKIPSNVTRIKGRAFKNATFKEGFYLPKGIIIDSNAFDDSNVWPGATVKTLDGKKLDWQVLSNQEKLEQAKKGFEVVQDLNIYELNNIY